MRVHVYRKTPAGQQVLVRPDRRLGMHLTLVSGASREEVIERARPTILAVAAAELPAEQIPF